MSGADIPPQIKWLAMNKPTDGELGFSVGWDYHNII